MNEKRKNPEEFMGFLVKNVPTVEPPPYFASRVAALAADQASDFMRLMDRIARWLLPAFAMLGVVVLLISYQASTHSTTVSYPEFLLEQDSAEQTVTTEYVLDSLQPQNPVE